VNTSWMQQRLIALDETGASATKGLNISRSQLPI
jgi:hypothetical protein